MATPHGLSISDMKKKILYLLFGFTILLFSFIIALPFLLESESIQQEILQRIEASYVVDASVTEVELSFFPLPHIDLFDVEIKHQTFRAFIPEVKIYPSWQIILGQAEIGRVTLLSPQFTLIKDPFSKTDPHSSEPPFILPGTLPGLTISIKNGRVQFPKLTTDLGIIHGASLAEITARLVLKKNRLKLDWQSNPSFGDDFDISATFSIEDLMGKGTIYLNHLDLEKAFESSPHSALAFIAGTSSFSSTFTYEPAYGLSLQFDGDVPDFTLTSPDLGNKPPVPIRVAEGHLSLTIRDDLFQLDIKSLEFSEPQLKLQGVYSYYLPEGSLEKFVKIDLKGADIDLTNVRKKLLDLVGSSIVTKNVTGIVQNGFASSAAYYFDAPIPAFADIENMFIEVDIERADIHLEHVPIDLQNARGKIRIKDGDLTGWDITTNVLDTKGRNGSFLMGLGRDNWGLRVDVDIDANLAELTLFLRNIIHRPDVAAELQLVSMTGRADGHLTIGEDLRDFSIIVDVDRFNHSEIRYDRVSWPISPQSGKLQVTDTGASWQNMAINIGNHILKETSGTVDWSEPNIPFELTSLRGIFDNNTILAELRSHPILQQALDTVVTTIVGSTQLVGTIKGSFFSPAEYIYDFDTKLKDMSVLSPRLPVQLSLATAHIRITDKSINIIETTGMVLGESLQLSGNLQHDIWLKWTGDLTFNGEMDQTVMDWLINEKMLAEQLKLNTPILLHNLRLKWQDDDLFVEGEIEPKNRGSRLNLKVEKNSKVVTGAFNISHKGKDAQIRFFSEPTKNNYDFFINGTLPGQALTDILADPFIQFETISGKMNIHVDFPEAETPPSMVFSGNLALTDLYLLIDHKRDKSHTISFSLVGKDNTLNIEQLDIRYDGDSLFSEGQFIHEGWSGHLDVNMQSPAINTDTVREIADNLEAFVYDRLGIERGTTASPSRYNLFSTLSFNFANFTVPLGEENNEHLKDEEKKQYQFPITPLKGRYSFNSTNSSLQIEDSMVCGLELEAFLTWYGDTETSKTVSVQTPAETTVELRDFLECFNSNAIIDGPMTFKAKASTRKGNVTTANFTLKSEGGFIYKFVAVAKAISVLNLKGWSGSIWKKGYYYNQIELSGVIDNNVLKISKLFIDGDGVDIVGKGTFDLTKMEYDMVFYVVPFSSISNFITNVPIVGRLLGGKEGRIISVPVKITGYSGDPEVSVMDVGEIGEATGRWIWDTVTIPFAWTSDDKASKERFEPEDLEEQATIPQGD